MYAIKDFVCKTTDCPDLELYRELFVDSNESPHCTKCNKPLTQALSPTYGKVLGSRFPVKQPRK